MFNFFPNTDFNKVNLDWIMRKLKEQISGLVASVNGMTGDVTLTASDVGALPDNYAAPVDSVNGQTGEVVLSADDVGAVGVNDISNVTSNSPDVVVSMPDETTFNTFAQNLLNMSTADIYNMYDEFSEFEKTFYGNDAMGNPLYYYTYNSPALKNSVNKTSYINTNNGYPCLFLVSGVHGSEKGAVIAAYLFIKEIFANKEKYGSLVNNVDIVVVPVAVPSGFNANSRYNSNDVDINRNFPNNFTVGEHTGAAALDQIESAFIAHMVDTLHETYQSGLFVVDAHQFLTTAASDYVFWYNCSSDIANYPHVRGALMKTVGWLRRKILADYPILAPATDSTTFTRFFQIDYEPTFESYFGYAGCSGFLCESMSSIKGGVLYSADSLKINYQILSASIWNTVTTFMPNAFLHITSLAQIGMDSGDTLSDVLSAMPYRSYLDVRLPSGTALHDEISTFLGALHLHVQDVGNNTKSLVVYTLSDTGPTTFMLTNTAINNQIVNKWTFPVSPGATQHTVSTVTVANIRNWQEITPLQILYVASGGELGVPNEGLLVVFHPQTDGTYDHTWLVNISVGYTRINITHFRPSTTAFPLTWRGLSLT